MLFRSDRTKAIVVGHMYGIVADMGAIMAIAKKQGLWLRMAVHASRDDILRRWPSSTNVMSNSILSEQVVVFLFFSATSGCDVRKI